MSQVLNAQTKCSLYVRGQVWYGGNRQTPTTGYHCVFEGTAGDAWELDAANVDLGADHDLDWDDVYLLVDGERHDWDDFDFDKEEN